MTNDDAYIPRITTLSRPLLSGSRALISGLTGVTRPRATFIRYGGPRHRIEYGGQVT